MHAIPEVRYKSGSGFPAPQLNRFPPRETASRDHNKPARSNARSGTMSLANPGAVLQEYHIFQFGTVLCS